jgi:hypothetical protein
MSSDDSPPRVRQRNEESVADWWHRMQTWQVLSEQNLLCADLRDPVLFPICLPSLSQTGTRILWQHDHHPG